MAKSLFVKQKTIPSVSTRKSAPTTTNFAAGIYTYKPNDTMDYDEIYLAENARFDRIGEYKTRRGLATMNEPIGKTTLIDNYTGNYTMKPAESITLPITITATDTALYSIELTVASTDATGYGVLQATLVDNVTEKTVASSCVKDLTTTPESREFIFKDAPTGDLTLKLSTQGDGVEKFNVAVPTDSQSTMMARVNIATSGKIIGLFEANIDSVITILFAFKTTTGNTTLYRMDPSGAIELIRVLPSDVEKVRFSQNVNQIRYTDGLECPHLIDPTTWSDSAIDTKDLKTGVDLAINTSNILPGTQDNLIYFDADTTTQAVWTYPYGFQYAPTALFSTTGNIPAYTIGTTSTVTVNKSTLTATTTTHLVSDLAVGDIIVDASDDYGKVTTISGNDVTIEAISHAAEAINNYDSFDRDFRQNFPAIKTGDPLTAMFNLGGAVFFLTRRNKYYMFSQTADVWTQQASPAQHGTFSQESVTCNLNYAYYANDDGIYMFDGSTETSLTQNTIQTTYDAIPDKTSIILELYGNRLYVFYSSNGIFNDSCLVYNINLKLWESFDTGLPVSSAIGRQTASNRLICGSNHFGTLFTYEAQTNEYADAGAPIAFNLETSYLHFGTPSQLHRITKWRPEFAKTPKPYTVKCGYALDFSENVKYAYSINLYNDTILDEHYVWDNPASYGNIITPTKLSTIPIVHGEFRRVQIRYQHIAAFEPVNMKSHTLSVQSQRIR